jgi:prepilin-type N-terminal cleavage/methylation domain-containing protein
MTRLGDQRGLTLIELLVAMTITTIVMGVVVFILTIFLNDSRYDTFRDQAQSDARLAVDRLSHDLRSAASTTASTPGLLTVAASYELAFQTVQPTGTAPAGNAGNQMWVRYCLNGATNTLWRQTTTPSNTTSSVPDTTNCPSTSNQWAQKTNGNSCCVELSDITNEIGGDTTRPLFTYGPSGWTANSQIKLVQVNVYSDLNPGHLPGPTPELISGIYLRNELAYPVAQFTPTANPGAHTVTLDGSASTDPNGQALTYQWYNGGTCSSLPSTVLAATEQYTAGPYSFPGNQTFELVVANTGGLSKCTSQTVAIQ